MRGAALPPAAGDECRRCRVPGLHVRWSVFRRRRGTSPSPTLGRRRCRRRRGMRAGGAGGGVAAGRLGMSAGPTLGRWLLFRWRLGMGAGRCRVPGLPRPVVGVSPAAGDERRPCIRSVALPPAVHHRTVVIVSLAVGDEGRPLQGSRPPTSGGRCFAGGGGQAPALHWDGGVAAGGGG